MPLPGDMRLLSLGEAAWQEALAEAGDAASAARAWSSTKRGQALLAALFGNSPFLDRRRRRRMGFPDPSRSRKAPMPRSTGLAETEHTRRRRKSGGVDARGCGSPAVASRLLAAVAELAGAWSLERQMAALSRFAEAAIDAAVRSSAAHGALRQACSRSSRPTPEQGSGLIVLGMGKLGGGELNYSSDIDLILLYDPAELRGARTRTTRSRCSAASPAIWCAFSTSAPAMAMFFAPICGCGPIRARRRWPCRSPPR